MKLDGRRMSDNISDHHRENMKRQIGADGDFAYAYVIAHEVGHHVQYLLGDLDLGDTFSPEYGIM